MVVFTESDGFANVGFMTMDPQYVHCDECGLPFRTQEGMLRHKDIRHDTHTHVCDLCKEYFLTATGLTAHRNIKHRPLRTIFRERPLTRS